MSDPEAPSRRASGEVTPRGPRVTLHFRFEDIVITADAAREYRDEITRVLRELGVES